MNTKVVHVICFPKNYTSCWQNLFLIRTGKGNTVREKYMKNTRNTNKIHILHHVEYIYLCVLKYKFMNLEHILCNTYFTKTNFIHGKLLRTLQSKIQTYCKNNWKLPHNSPTCKISYKSLWIFELVSFLRPKIYAPKLRNAQ